MRIGGSNHHILNDIIHDLNKEADEFYSYAHPVKIIVIDENRLDLAPKLLPTPWVNKNGKKTNQKRILVGSSYLAKLINDKLEIIKTELFNEFFKEE